MLSSRWCAGAHARTQRCVRMEASSAHARHHQSFPLIFSLSCPSSSPWHPQQSYHSLVALEDQWRERGLPNYVPLSLLVPSSSCCVVFMLVVVLCLSSSCVLEISLLLVCILHTLCFSLFTHHSGSYTSPDAQHSGNHVMIFTTLKPHIPHVFNIHPTKQNTKATQYHNITTKYWYSLNLLLPLPFLPHRPQKNQWSALHTRSPELSHCHYHQARHLRRKDWGCQRGTVQVYRETCSQEVRGSFLREGIPWV